MALDGVPGQDHLQPLPTGTAIGRRPVAREITGVPVLARAHRGEGVQPWLAAWLAALLVLAPFARPSLPVDLAAAPAGAAEELVAHDGAEGEHPAAGLLSAQPLALGILSRPSLVETTLGLPPLKSPLLRPAADRPLPAHAGAAALGAEPLAILQRSAVGTARTPTGPPA